MQNAKLARNPGSNPGDRMILSLPLLLYFTRKPLFLQCRARLDCGRATYAPIDISAVIQYPAEERCYLISVLQRQGV